ncbi:uncharacterized protein [Centruroides vittatus]|uniref:uncharacterized protein n=1 Tax=Centruroides vittatus TaxID=120091 RepID=UPI00350F8941
MYSKLFVLAGIISVGLAEIGHHIHHYYPQPYAFGYEIKDPHHGSQWRKENSDGHKVEGSYGYVDAWGIKRQVDYIADKHGFRAKVKTNEPGTANEDPAHVKMNSHAYQPHVIVYNAFYYKKLWCVIIKGRPYLNCVFNMWTQFAFLLFILSTIDTLSTRIKDLKLFGMPYGWSQTPIHLYEYGYDIVDKHGNKHWKKEEKNKKGAVIGSYGYINVNGIKRFVNYVADHKGFRVKINSNEPGTANQHPAHMFMIADANCLANVSPSGEEYSS